MATTSDDAGGRRRALYVNLALAALLWTYTLARAVRLSFTHDESLTYLIAVKAPLLDTLRYDLRLPSNNHLLNSLLAKLFSSWSIRPVALRFPNLLAHAAYLLAALQLARRVAPAPASVFAFVALTLHPFLLDFFSMCRGYGLACGFELVALWLMVKRAEQPHIRPWESARASLAAALCPLSNLSFLVFFLAFGVLTAMLDGAKWALSRTPGSGLAQQPLQRLLGALALQLGIAGGLCAFVVPIGLKLRELGELYYGGENGFVADTLGSLFDASTYYKSYPEWVRSGVVCAGVLLALGTLFWAVRSALQRQLAAAALCGLPLLTAFVCVVQHRVMHTKFPVDRTALFFVPMFAGALVTASAGSRLPGWRSALLGTVALALVVNATQTLNLRYFAQWQYDADTSRMLKQLAKLRGKERIWLGANWLFEPSINYYREQRGLHWLARVRRGNLHDDLDYYYFLPEDQAALAEQSLERLADYPTSGASLARQRR